jgi:hypothetical protein
MKRIEFTIAERSVAVLAISPRAPPGPTESGGALPCSRASKPRRIILLICQPFIPPSKLVNMRLVHVLHAVQRPVGRFRVSGVPRFCGVI